MSNAAPPVDNETSTENTGYGSKSYRTYVLGALTLIYVLNSH